MEDCEIVRRVRAGDVEAFAPLVEKYQRQVLTFIDRLVPDKSIVEDLGQEVFVSAYRSLANFDEERGTPFAAWLFTIARNRCVSELRRRRQVRAPVEMLDELADGGASADRRLQSRERLMALTAVLEELPLAYRAALLDSLRGVSPQESADRAGLSATTIKTRLFRARDRLRRLLGALEDGGS